MKVPGGRTITENTDARSRLSAVNDGVSVPIVQYAYDPGDRVGSRAYRNDTRPRRESANTMKNIATPPRPTMAPRIVTTYIVEKGKPLATPAK